MLRFVGRRLAGLLAVVLGALVVVFIALRLSGDPVVLLLPQDASPADIEAMRRQLGLDQPLPVQFWRFLEKAISLDFGTSLRYRQPAMWLVLDALPTTIVLTVVALLISVVVGISLGVMAALRRGTKTDAVAIMVSLIGQAMPVFWLGLLLILIFAVNLHWLPTGGWGSPEYVILPAIALGAYSTARLTRLVRSGMIEALQEDFVRTARSKGLRPRRVLMVHALKNTMLPVITLLGLEFGVLLGGAVLTETVFSIPGLGRLTVNAVLARDYPVVQAAVLCGALVISLTTLATDLIVAFLDPRIRIR